MTRIIVAFIPLAALLLAACSAASTPVPTPTEEPTNVPTEVSEPTSTSPPTSSAEATPTAEATTVPTEAPQPTATSTTSPGENMDQANADVTHVRAVLAQDGRWTFHVTVAHPDTGWEDYADGWDVLTPDGTVLKAKPDDPFTRLLLHPHENEQPFTRSQSGINIPSGVTQVRVRAHDIVAGWGGQEILVDLEQDSGPGFEVER